MRASNLRQKTLRQKAVPSSQRGQTAHDPALRQEDNVPVKYVPWRIHTVERLGAMTSGVGADDSTEQGISSRAAHAPHAHSRLRLPAKGGSASMFSRTRAGVPAGTVVSAEFG